MDIHQGLATIAALRSRARRRQPAAPPEDQPDAAAQNHEDDGFRHSSTLGAGWLLRLAASGLGWGCRWISRTSLVGRVLVPVVAAAGTPATAPWPPEEKAEQQEADQQDPEQPEERKEAEPVIAGIENPPVRARGRDDVTRLAGVVRDESHHGRNCCGRQRPPRYESSVHVDTSLKSVSIFATAREGAVNARRSVRGGDLVP